MFVQKLAFMKTILLCALLMLGLCGPSSTLLAQNGRSSDDVAVMECLLDYMDGGTFGDTTRLFRAFHPSASMKFVDNKTGEFKDVPIAEFLNRSRGNAGKTQERQCRITYYKVTGTAAQGAVVCEYATFRFLDYFNLVKINGQWKIVSKVFYREEKTNR